MKDPRSDPADSGGHADVVGHLARLASQGDREGIARTLQGYVERLERCVRFRMDPALRPRLDPSDVVQEVMVEAIDRLAAWLESPDMELFLWLRFLAIQRLLQMRRFHGRQRRDAHRERSFAATSCADLADRLAADVVSPSSALGRKERREALVEALAALEESDREILVLRCLEELSNGEAARILELNESTASSRFLRALKRAQAALGA